MKPLAVLILAGAALPGSAAAACRDAAYRIAVPAHWSTAVTEGITTFRNVAGTEGLTLAVYEFRAGAAARDTVVREAVTRARAHERASGTVSLSSVTARRQGRRLELRYTGADERGGRRFASLTVGSPCYLQSFYYEALDVSAPRFARLARQRFDRLDFAAPAPPPVLPALWAGLPRLPAIGGLR